MKTFVFTVAAFLAVSTTFAQTWAVDKGHARAGFTVTHNLLSDVDGNFKTFDAKIIATKADLSDAVFEFTADVNSISTDNERRDGHLKSPDFFDAAKFSTITFKSTSFKKVEGKQYKITGDLTMHGVTKPISLNATLAGPVAMKGMGGKEQEKAGFKIGGTIKRSDFGIGTIPVVVVSDEVEVKVNGEFTRQDASAMAEKK